MKKGLISLILTLLIFSFSSPVLGAQENKSRYPEVFSQSPVTSIFWNEDNSQFSYFDKDKIYIRNQATLIETYTINIQNGEFLDFFYINDSGYPAKERIVAITDQNVILIWDEPFEEPAISFKSEKNEAPVIFAISSDYYYFAAGYNDGTVSIFTRDYSSEQGLSETNFPVAETAVSKLAFSRNSNSLLTGSSEGLLRIWDLSSGMDTGSIPFEPEDKTTAFFSADNSKIIQKSTENSITVYDFMGNPKRNISVNSPIKSIKKYDDGRIAAILSEDNSISIFSLDNGVCQGTIPSLNQGEVTAFDIDESFTNVLLGYADGKIQVLQVNKVLLPEGLEPKNEDQPEETEASEPETMEIYKMTETKTILRYKNSDAVNFKAGAVFLPYPYFAGIVLNGGYANYTLLQPFYFGGVIEWGMGFPDGKFPYSYQIFGQNIANPKLNSVKIYVPLGICLYPFLNDIEFFADLDAGISLNWLWNGAFKNNSAGTKCYPAFYGALRMGVNYSYLSGYIQANYDALVGFSIGIGAGANINFKQSTVNNFVRDFMALFANIGKGKKKNTNETEGDSTQGDSESGGNDNAVE